MFNQSVASFHATLAIFDNMGSINSRSDGASPSPRLRFWRDNWKIDSVDDFEDAKIERSRNDPDLIGKNGFNNIVPIFRSFDLLEL